MALVFLVHHRMTAQLHVWDVEGIVAEDSFGSF